MIASTIKFACRHVTPDVNRFVTPVHAGTDPTDPIENVRLVVRTSPFPSPPF